LKWIVLAVALIISSCSILYTNSLVDQIREREKRQIEIYARSLEFLANESSNANFILDEIITANNTIPVILTDQDGTPEFHKNIRKLEGLIDEEQILIVLLDEVQKMKRQYEPIQITLEDTEGNIYGSKIIYYKNSFLLNQLKYYPYVQLSVIGLFGFITFFILNYLKKSEQNRVWIGMAKETAHQLGTPLSSLMAWSEYFKETIPGQDEILKEFDKDVDRFKVITDRFSSIGSEPQLTRLNVIEVIEEIIAYLGKRLSSKIEISISWHPDRNIFSRMNASLFAWVIENLCKNAADAMEGKGSITISVLKVNSGQIAIDVKDTGKGISKFNAQDVFRPGYTTKKRGWGLGLALAKRIIEQYHQGKIFVKGSEINKGTTFRIYLKG
jgi:nitrogen-specific signal transduction histidine kinase